MSRSAGSPTAFDALAPSYDQTFSRSGLGARLRARVWRQLDHAFQAGDHVLDVGCGTGEDAVHLASRGVRVTAIDASSAMANETRAKVERASLAELVEVRTAAAEGLTAGLADAPLFDGVLSNFGVLNCVSDLEGVAAQMAACTRTEARVFLCVMGPIVPWEWGWYLLRGRPATAFRRLRRGGTEWRGVQVRYPTIGATCRAFRAGFRAVRVAGLGALLPPPYAEAWTARHPRVVTRLGELDERCEDVPPFPWLADHYLLELVRR